MHYTTAYKSHSREDNTLRAMEDCQSYLGERYSELVEKIRDTLSPTSSLADKYRAIELICSFVGIQGYYPVRAMVAAVLRPQFEPMMLRAQAH